MRNEQEFAGSGENIVKHIISMRFDDCTMDHGRFIATTLESMMRCL